MNKIEFHLSLLLGVVIGAFFIIIIMCTTNTTYANGKSYVYDSLQNARTDSVKVCTEKFKNERLK